MLTRKAIIVAGTLLTLGAMAQAPQTVRLATTYTPNSWLVYSISATTKITTRTGPGAALHATLVTQAEAQLHVLPGATTNDFEIAARFNKYSTTVRADNAAQKAGLEKQAAATDQAAVAMKPALFRVVNGVFSTVFRQPGDHYDQPADMLSELTRNDVLPRRPVAVGAQWTRTRERAIPTTTISMPLTLRCRLAALGSEHGDRTAAIAVDSTGSANLPPGSLPDSQKLASQGLVPLGRFSTKTTANSVYRVADGVLLATSSQTHSSMQLQFIGPSPQAATSDSEIDSTGSVKLEKILAN
ncbi:MAG: hypothetical protein EPN33_05975 [Acidobacteria bacterium]|nr:MAG: hypothetical protein EPN33_05975 [Acidobacteriota bacterium]